MPKQYPPEFQNEVITSCESGVTISDISHKYGIAQSAIYRWLKAKR